jgi:ribosomal protein S15P/S13E
MMTKDQLQEIKNRYNTNTTNEHDVPNLLDYIEELRTTIAYVTEAYKLLNNHININPYDASRSWQK